MSARFTGSTASYDEASTPIGATIIGIDQPGSPPSLSSFRRDDDAGSRHLERQPSAALDLELVERRNTTQHPAARREAHCRRNDEVIALRW